MTDTTDNPPRPARRVAVCLAGVARNAKQNLRFMRQFLDRSGADVFFHFWETPDAEQVIASLAPRAHVFEGRDKAPPRANPRRPEQFTLPSRLTNIPSMFYSIQRVNELRRAYEAEHGFRYDVVVRLRLDFFSVTPLVDILERLPADPAEWERTLFVPDMAHAMGVNDQLALGTSDVMDVYAGTYDRLRRIEHEDEMYVAEYVLLRHLLANGVRIRPFAYEYVLLPAKPIATFDLKARIEESSRGWWVAPMPVVPPENVEPYLVAHADSYALVDALELETPKAFRLRGATRGYLRYDPGSRGLSFTREADAASLFLVILANDGDRRAVNIRPREAVFGSLRPDGDIDYNLRPDERGVVRVEGGEEDESAFLLATAPGGMHTFEWRAGFWRTPWGHAPDRDPKRELGGREYNPPPLAPRRKRQYLQLADDGLRVAPGAPEPFALERVSDPVVESSMFGIIGGVYEGPPRPEDPIVGRLAWMGYRAVRTIEERGLGVVLTRAVAYVRRRIDREPQPPKHVPAPRERGRRERI